MTGRVKITGGGSGIGAAAAGRLANDGPRVALLDARQGAADHVAAGSEDAPARGAD